MLAVQSVAPIIEAVTSPALGSPTQVEEGSTVNAIYLSVEIQSILAAFTSVPRVYLAVFKNVASTGNRPASNGTGTSALKKRVIHQEMTAVAQDPAISQFPRTLFKGVIKIPKSLRRFGYLDKLEVLLQNGAGELTGIANVCVQTIYKEYQ